MKRTFEMNGKAYMSMMDIARELGVKRVYPKDFEKYGIKETTDVADEADKADVADEADKADVATKANKADEATKADIKVKTSNKKTDKGSETPESILNKVSTLNIVEFNNAIRKWTVDTLVKLAELSQVQTWESITNEPIRKMRLLMELKKKYFPNDKIPVSPASIWRGIELNTLLKMADDNKLVYRKSDEQKTQRMWVIKALNDAGIKPQGGTSN